MRLNLLLLLLIGIFACKSNKKTPVNAQTPAADRPMIQLQTTGCRGYCPVYRLLVFENGKVEYEGIRNMERMGKAEFQLSPEELAALTRRVEAVNLWQFPTEIPTHIADAPGFTLTAYRAGLSHAVSGSADVPMQLLVLQNDMKDLAEAHGFVVKRGVNPNEKNENTAQVIVKLKPEVNAGNWIIPFRQHNGLQLVRRLGEENIWLISYSPDSIQEKLLLEMLKADDEVLEAQANRETQQRN